MGKLYFLSFRDIHTSSTGVTAGELYGLDGVDAGTDWRQVALTGAQWVPWGQVADVLRNKRVCFLVHGFNVTAGNGVRSCGPAGQEFEALGVLNDQIKAADLVITVLWPGDGLLGWDWFTAFNHSKTTGRYFADFLTSSAFTASEVSFVSHSLGARVVLETVAQTATRKHKVNFDTAILMAAAVDDVALDDPEYSAATASLRRIVVLSSTMDNVLKVYFTVGDFAEKLLAETGLWFNYHGDTRALGRYGPAFKANSEAPAKTEWYEIRPGVRQDHSDYLPAGWTAPPPANGWTDKSKNVGVFCRDLFDAKALAPDLPDWASDNTPRFRPDWPPKL